MQTSPPNTSEAHAAKPLAVEARPAEAAVHTAVRQHETRPAEAAVHTAGRQHETRPADLAAHLPARQHAGQPGRTLARLARPTGRRPAGGGPGALMRAVAPAPSSHLAGSPGAAPMPTSRLWLAEALAHSGPRAGAAADRLAAALRRSQWPIAAYAGSRALLLLVACVAALVRHAPLTQEAFLFDGQWYLRLAEHGYPAMPLRTQSTLGFLPLYPLAIQAVAWISPLGVPQAAVAVSIAGGLAAAVLAHRLGAAWWGEQAGRRAALVFCLFPGAIVFSMAYSECLTLPLALGCLLALRSRRWPAAGVLAGLAGAVEPVALVLIPVCLAAAAGQVRALGWRDPAARRSIAAPLIAPLGIGCFAVFLWAWTGTPFASYYAQHYGWHQQGQPLALLALPLAQRLISHPALLLPRLLAWNIANGIAGGVFLTLSIRALLRVRRELSTGALLLTVGVAAVTLWSVLTPPNARMSLIAFPAVMVWGRRLSGRQFGLFVAAEVIALLATSALTFSGHMLP